MKIAALLVFSLFCIAAALHGCAHTQAVSTSCDVSGDVMSAVQGALAASTQEEAAQALQTLIDAKGECVIMATLAQVISAEAAQSQRAKAASFLQARNLGPFYCHVPHGARWLVGQIAPACCGGTQGGHPFVSDGAIQACGAIGCLSKC